MNMLSENRHRPGRRERGATADVERRGTTYVQF